LFRIHGLSDQSFQPVIEPVEFVVARSESVGKLWAAGTLSMIYPHGSARTGPQDASTNPPVTSLLVVPTVNSHAALPVFHDRYPVQFAAYAPFFSFMRFAHQTDARQSPIRIKTVPLTKGKRFVPGTTLRPRKMIGAKPCPIVRSTTGDVVFR
jgi:hypothetical protein